jgi:hypothetical protein
MSGGPWLPITSARTLRACAEFPARADDVFICSYPKSGTTWCQNLVARILTRSRGDEPAPPESWSHVSEVSPFFEIDPHWDHENEPSSLAANVVENHRRFVRGRRVFNTHLPLALMPRVGKDDDDDYNKNRKLPKIVYVARDGRDCAVSFWHHLKSQSVEDGGFSEGWDTFFESWIEGTIAFGSWFDHLNGWRDASADANVLVLKYEDMLHNLPGTIRAVAEHVDGDRPLTTDELDAIERACTFEAMKTNIDKYQPKSVRWIDDSFSFVRRGVSGSYEKVFSENQKRRFEEKAREKFGGGGLANAPMWRTNDS